MYHMKTKERLVKALNDRGIHSLIGTGPHQLVLVKHAIFTASLVQILLDMHFVIVWFIQYGQKVRFSTLDVYVKRYSTREPLLKAIDDLYLPEFDFGYYVEMDDLPLFFKSALFQSSKDTVIYPLFSILAYPDDINRGDIGSFTYTKKNDDGEVVFKVTCYHNLKHFLINYTKMKWFIGRTIESSKNKLKALLQLKTKLLTVDWKVLCRLRVEISISARNLNQARQKMEFFGLNSFESIVFQAFGVSKCSNSMIFLSETMFYDKLNELMAFARRIVIGQNDAQATSFMKMVVADVMSMFGFHSQRNTSRYCTTGVNRVAPDSYFKQLQYSNAIVSEAIVVNRTADLNEDELSVRDDIEDAYLRSFHRSNHLPNFTTKKGGQGKSFLTVDEVIDHILTTYGGNWRANVMANK